MDGHLRGICAFFSYVRCGGVLPIHRKKMTFSLKGKNSMTNSNFQVFAVECVSLSIPWLNLRRIEKNEKRKKTLNVKQHHLQNFPQKRNNLIHNKRSRPKKKCGGSFIFSSKYTLLKLGWGNYIWHEPIIIDYRATTSTFDCCNFTRTKKIALLHAIVFMSLLWS